MNFDKSCVNLTVSCVGLDPSEGTARSILINLVLISRLVALGPTRVRVLQVEEVGRFLDISKVASSATRPRVLQDHDDGDPEGRNPELRGARPERGYCKWL